MELIAARADERGIEVVLDWPQDVPRRLVGDAMRFRQVLLNLTGNAVKFTSAGSVEVHVAREAEGLVRVRVTDTGIGVSEEKIGQLFRKFTQADSSTTRRFGGTGLGLAISKQLVDLMGGQIGAESAPGRGSTFWFTMPVATEVGATLPPSRERRDLRVLVVDDLPSSRAVLLAALEPLAAEVAGVANAGDATVLLRAASAAGRAFDAVFIDSGLPGTDGETLACAIAADPGVGAPALVLLVPGSRRAEASRLRAGSFADVIVKPLVHPEVLAAALARAAEHGARSGLAPSSEPVASAPVAGPEVPRSPASAPVREGCRVLLAEDQPINQKLAVRVLTRLGCKVDLAQNGLEARSLATTNDYAMVFMDCHMPEMDGYEATAAIRTDEQAGLGAGRKPRHTPIVALTASVLKADRDRCFASGMDDFISKPFRADQLESALRRWASGEGDSEGTLREAA